jgi:Right handed beta helix region
MALYSPVLVFAASERIHVRDRRLFGLLLGVGLFVLMGFGAHGASAAAAVHCGEVVTQSITLTTDLQCQGDGLTVAANGVTVDLAGHTLTGQGIGVGISVRGAETAFLSNVTIRNGSIRSFDQGIRVRFAGAVVRQVNLQFNSVATVSLESSPSLTDNNIDANGTGISISRSSATIDALTGESAELRSNTITRSARNGIELFQIDALIPVSDNTVTGSGSYGVFAFDARAQVEGNALTGNVTAGIAPGASSTVTQNVIARNGLGVFATSGVPVNHNRIVHNARQGIYSTAAIIADSNDVRGNGSDGIVSLAGGEIRSNVADHNGGDGIHVLSGPADIVGNHAWFNGNLGIEAFAGATGSGNWAKHNGNTAQCVPISLCSAGGRPH